MNLSYDIVGDLIIINDVVKKKEADKLLKTHKNVKVVLSKTKKYSGKFRLPKLKVIAGERRKETIHKENNARLKLKQDIADASVEIARKILGREITKKDHERLIDKSIKEVGDG